VSVVVKANSVALDASAAHDGYVHLGVFHHRRVQVTEGGVLAILDRLEGRGSHHFEGGWLLAAEWTAAVCDFGWELSQQNHVLHVTLRGPGGLQRSVTSRPWHPRFGIELRAQRLVWEWHGELPFEVQTIVAPPESGRR
jgi:hypothetical protein